MAPCKRRTYVDYVASELRRLGLRRAIGESPCAALDPGEEKAELVKFPGQMSGYPAPENYSDDARRKRGNSPTGLIAEVVTVDSFEELEGLGRANVEGKIVLFNRRFDEQNSCTRVRCRSRPGQW